MYKNISGKQQKVAWRVKDAQGNIFYFDEDEPVIGCGGWLLPYYAKGKKRYMKTTGPDPLWYRSKKLVIA